MKNKMIKFLVSISFLLFSANAFAAGKLNLYNWADCTPEELLERLNNIPNMNTECLILNPLKFEKDDDTNYHIDFITNASNLRAPQGNKRR